VDPLYNALLLLVDATTVALVARARTRAHALLGLGTAAVVFVVLAALLGAGPFHLLRLYAYAIFLHGPLVLLGTAWASRTNPMRISGACLASAVLLLAVAADAFLIEPTWLEVTELSFESPKLTRPLRIAVVADLQADHIGAYEKRVLSRVMEAQPDLILMPGDYLHEPDPERRDELARQLRSLLQEVGLAARLGVYATRGNIEDDDWHRIFEGLPVTPILTTETFDLGEVQLTGLDLPTSFDVTARIPARSERYHIVFGHAPDFALGSVEADLLIAGHTHGGQVRLPFLGPLITFSRVPRSWAAGVTRLPGGGDRTLVVSRGIGMERVRAPRMRFLCRPEIILIDLRPPGTRGDRSGVEDDLTTVSRVRRER